MRLLVILLLSAATALAGPSIKVGDAKVALNKNSEFTISFKDGAKSKTEGDPMVFWGNRFFFWPTKNVTYVLPRGEMIGYADGPQGYTSTLLVNEKNKPLRLFLFDPKMKKAVKTFTIPSVVRIGKEKFPFPLAAFLRKFAARGTKLIFVGGKIGWKRGDGRPLVFHDASHAENFRPQERR